MAASRAVSRRHDKVVRWFVDDELEPLYLHIASVYPLAPTTATTLEVMRRVYATGRKPARISRRAWLRRLARTTVANQVDDLERWRQINREAIEMDLRASVAEIVRPGARAEMQALADASTRWTVDQLEIMRMMAVEDLTVAELAAVMGIARVEVERLVAAVYASLPADDAKPSSAEEGGSGHA